MIISRWRIAPGPTVKISALFGSRAKAVMPRSISLASATPQLGEEAFDEVEPGAVRGSEGELKPAGGLLGEPSSGLSGDMRGMIVEDQMDRRVGRIGRVDELEEFDELPATVAILHQGVN